MSDVTFDWKQGVDWKVLVTKVGKYLHIKKLKHGDKGDKKARPFIASLCSQETYSRAQLRRELGLTDDGVATILSDVTMAIQEKYEVWSPENGGWYVSIGARDTLTYVVCPGFADAWRARYPRS